MRSHVPHTANVSIKAIAGSAVRAGSYRTGENLWSERLAEYYKHDYRINVHRDVIYKQTLLPGFAHDKPEFDWARNRHKLLNNAELAQRTISPDKTAAYDHRMELPPGLNLQQNIALLDRYGQANVDRFRSVMVYAIHEPRQWRAETRHAHMLEMMNRVTPYGFSDKTDFAVGGQERLGRGLMSREADYEWKRATWERFVDEAMIGAKLQHSQEYEAFKKRHLLVSSPGYSKPDYSEEEKLGRKITQREDLRLQRPTAAEREQIKQWELQAQSRTKAGMWRERQRQLELARAWEREQMQMPSVASPPKQIAENVGMTHNSAAAGDWLSFEQMVAVQPESTRIHYEEQGRDLVSLSHLLQERSDQSTNDEQLNLLRLKQPQAKQFEQDRAAFYAMTRDWLALKLERDRRWFRERAKARAYAPARASTYASSNDLGM